MTVASSPVAAPADARSAARPARLVSLDAFRGFVIAGMLLVNNVIWNAATPAQLKHAPWNQGVTFTDMIFPWFLFAMGTAIPLSAAASREKGVTGWRYAGRVLRRTVILIALGLLVDSSVAGRPALGLGVLQLLGLTYVVGALLADLPIWARAAIAAALLAVHWALIAFLPVPGVGAGVLEEGRNAIAYLNQTYLARRHLNGIISVVPTSALVLLGTIAGDVLRGASPPRRAKLAALVASGAALALAGWLWGWTLPLNKPVWTSSYILFSGGLGALLLAACYAAFDLAGWRAAAFPFVVFGANAIVVYVASILIKVHVLQEWQHRTAGGRLVSVQQALLDALARRIGPVSTGWLYTAGFILFWWLVLLYLYRRRIFVRV